MATRYFNVGSDADLMLILAGCDCDGYDIVRQLRKSERDSSEYGACLCGRIRAIRRPMGHWSVMERWKITQFKSVVKDRSSFSVTGNPSGSPINELKKAP